MILGDALCCSTVVDETRDSRTGHGPEKQREIPDQLEPGLTGFKKFGPTWTRTEKSQSVIFRSLPD